MKNFSLNPRCHYLAFFKPYAVLCQFTLPDGSDKKTLAEFAFPRDVYSVGRLDYDSEGLIILTDDARLNSQLLTPDIRHQRKYLVQVENIPTPEQLAQLEAGVILDGKPTLPCQARLLDEEPRLPPRPVPIRERKNIPTSWLELVLHEGKNRQVRRMTAAVGCPTLRLIRVAIGELNMFQLRLKPGDWTALDEDQIDSLFRYRLHRSNY